MNHWPLTYWQRVRDRLLRRVDDEQLSAFVDDELVDEPREEMATRLALDPGTRRQLNDLRRVSNLVAGALQPAAMPSADRCADVALGLRPQTIHRAESADRRIPGSTTTHRAVLASVGLLVTAGVAFVGLRRRGVV